MYDNTQSTTFRRGSGATGINDSVFHSRAIPWGRDLDNDPEVMVHQQLARLYFFQEKVGTTNKTILDFGCGSGFNSHLLINPTSFLGFDYSPDAVALAQKLFPGFNFVVADGCDPNLRLGKFQRIICCEVLEHVSNMQQLVKNIAEHLTDDGIAFITTPNVAVFSNGHRPSPINREHIYELDIDEFRELMRYFSCVRIFGQRFVRQELADAWRSDVECKIGLLEAGTRWRKPVAHHPWLRAIHTVPPVKWFWRQLRWRLIEGIRKRRAVLYQPYNFRDFDFIEDRVSEALWFCAIVSR